MKIVPYLTKEQEEYLFRTYNINNSVIIPEGRKRAMYLIPKEFVLYPYDARRHHIYPGEETEYNWVGSNALGNILWKVGRIGTQEWFDVMVLHINDTDNRPECPICGKEIGFKSLKQGYGNHPYTGRELWFCSNECCTTWQLRHPELPVGGFRSFEGNIEAKRTTFNNRGISSDKCIFYISKYGMDGIKFGITENLKQRSLLAYCEGLGTDLHPILEDSRAFVADLEANIKYYLDFASEIIPWTLVPKFIEAFGVELIKLRALYNQ